MQTLIKLTVRWLHKKANAKRQQREVVSDHSYFYYGDTKKECIEKAKRAFHYSSYYKKEWSKETFTND